jgi:hypothetical protein
VVTGLVGHLRRFFLYGAGAGGAGGGDSASGGGGGSGSAAGGDGGAAAGGITSPSKAGYVPPHLRNSRGGGGGGGGGSSDSDASDSDSLSGGRDVGDRFGASRVRSNAVLCVASLARGNPRSLHGGGLYKLNSDAPIA